MDAITIFPENKSQEKALEAMLKAFKVSFSKSSTIMERMEKLEDMMDRIEIEAARKEPTRPWEEIRAELDKQYGITTD